MISEEGDYKMAERVYFEKRIEEDPRVRGL